MIPKVMQIAEEAPHIYEAADRIIELRTGSCTSCAARSSEAIVPQGIKRCGVKKRGIRQMISLRN